MSCPTGVVLVWLQAPHAPGAGNEQDTTGDLAAVT